MQKADFYQLSRAVQDRFTSSVRGEGRPVPLLAIRTGLPRQGWAWWGAGAGAALALALLFRLGLGDLDSALAMHPAAWMFGYAALVFAMALSVLQVGASLRASSELPYRPGIYLFPCGVIDARTAILRTFPLSGDVKIEPGQRQLSLAFPEGETFLFDLGDPGRVEPMERDIRAAQSALEQARALHDTGALGVLDPTQDIGVANPFAPTASLQRDEPRWARQPWLFALLAGALLAPPVWLARNQVSDAALLVRANQEKSVEGYQRYLARGGHRPEVTDTLLPRAELAVAVQRGGVEAIEAYAAERTKSHIEPEIAAALRQAMLVEVDAAKRAGTVSALADLARRHPNHLVDAELRQAIHAVYQAALAQYRKDSGIKDPVVVAFVERLLSFAERSGPKVIVRFRRKVTRSLEIADAQVKKSPFFMGPGSSPAQYFDDAHSRLREAVTAKTLIARFAAAFPPDVLLLEHGPALNEPEGPLAASIVSSPAPTLLIEHSAEVSGASYLSANPRGVFVGLGMLFEVTFRVPDEGKPLRFRLSAWRPPDTTVPKGDDTFESAVYEAMASEGFAQFAQKYLVSFFPKPESKLSN